MIVKTEVTEDYTIVNVQGEIYFSDAEEFEKLMMEVVQGGCSKLILDCTGLTYISSASLRVFLIIQRKMSIRKGKFYFCCADPKIVNIFDLTGFSSVFPRFPDRQSAIDN